VLQLKESSRVKADEERQRPEPRYGSLTDWARDAAQGVVAPVARFFARLGFHPNTLTIIGFVLSVGVAVLLATGRLMLAGWLLLIVAPLDAFDGALARFLNAKSRFGAFLDSTLDRLSDLALLFGLMIHYLLQGLTAEVVLAGVAMVGSVMVSYARARAEALDFDCKVGLFTRLERTLVLIVGLIIGRPTVALWILAVGTNLTVLHRILHVYRLSRSGSPQK
jgi:CDP-diacylglycerol--glycerol-3-phosphate 3-phosphatidyltransferase